MRILAHDSQSKFLCDKFNAGADIHTETAMLVFGLKNESDIDKFEHRLPAKTTNFGLIYGEQGPGLSDQLRTLGLEGWDVKACDKLQKEIIKLFQIEPYIRSLTSQARKAGLIRDHWGMMRYLPHLSSRNPKLAAEAGRQAIAHRISGTAQGMIQNSMRWLREKIWELQDAGCEVKWRLQIHDELILSFPEWMWEVVDPIVLEGLVKHCGVRLRVPVLAEGHWGKSWADLK
jgi:DNA polymerase-1